jgi:hypothetical protein
LPVHESRHASARPGARFATTPGGIALLIPNYDLGGNRLATGLAGLSKTRHNLLQPSVSLVDGCNQIQGGRFSPSWKDMSFF